MLYALLGRGSAAVLRRLYDGCRKPIERPGELHLGEPSARRELILICSDAWLAAR